MNNLINKNSLSRNFISFSHNDTNNNYYLNYSGKIFKSDLFARKIANFKNNFTGFVNYEERLLNKSIEPISSFNIDNNNFYFPKIEKFDGYFQFPRKKNFSLSNNKIFQEKLNKTFNNNYYNNLLNSNKKNLNFLTKICYEEKLKKKDDEKIINSIDYEIKKFNHQIEFKKKTNFSFVQIQTLKNFKRKILNNNNNLKLNQPSKKIKEKFKIIQNLILNKSKNKEKNNELKFDEILTKKKFEFRESDEFWFLSTLKRKDLLNKMIKSHKIIKNQHSKEKELLKGFLKPKKKIKGIFQQFNYILNNNKKIYEKDLNLIKIVNPIHIKKEEEDFLKDKKLFLKMRNYKKILLNNIKK